MWPLAGMGRIAVGYVLRGFGGVGGRRKICTGQAVSNEREGAACVSDKCFREESRSLLLNLNPKICREKRKKNTFISLYQLLLLVASSFPSSLSSAAIHDLSVHRSEGESCVAGLLCLGERCLLLGTWGESGQEQALLLTWGMWARRLRLFQPSTGLKVALLEGGVEERDGSLADKDLPVLIEVFGGSSFYAAAAF